MIELEPLEAYKWLLDSQIEKMPLKSLGNVLKPSGGRKPLKNFVDLGFDSEYDDGEGLLCSMSFSAFKQNGEIVKASFEIMKPHISREEFASLVLGFLKEHGLGLPKNVFLISHFAQSEIKYIRDYFRAFKLRAYNRALGWEGEFGEEIVFKGGFQAKGFRIRVIDLYGYFPMSLEEIGSAIGLEKKRLDSYWIKHMAEFFRKHPEEAHEYAGRDSMIALKAWRWLYEEYMSKGIDPHHYSTLPSLAIADFRRNYMKHVACSYAVKMESKPRKLKGKWVTRLFPRYVYDGSMDQRLMALRCYWGGNNQAFIRGYTKGEMAFYDIISLYIASAILQPLPNEFTEWISPVNLSDIETLEGFGKVSFKFPEDCLYPCLPVMIEPFPKLVFPLQGETYATFVEMREALKMGCELEGLSGYGFKPSPNEIDHDLKPFLKEMLAKKERAKKGSIDYALEKLKMVSTIGKFAQRTPHYDITRIQEPILKGELSLEAIREHWSKREFRARYEYPSLTGSAWSPEWACLILGKARALMTSLIAKGCILVSTDGGLWMGEADLRGETLRALEEAGSGMRLEGYVDEALILRNRVYGAWLQGEPIHLARHAIHLKKSRDPSQDEWNLILREQIQGGKVLHHSYTRKRLTTIKDFMLKDMPLGSEEKKDLIINYSWDFKRKLQNPNVNPWREWTTSKPYATVEEALRDSKKAGLLEEERQAIERLPIQELYKKAEKGAKRGRKPKIPEPLLEEIRSLRAQGKSARAIAEIMHVDHKTVLRALRE